MRNCTKSKDRDRLLVRVHKREQEHRLHLVSVLCAPKEVACRKRTPLRAAAAAMKRLPITVASIFESVDGYVSSSCSERAISLAS